MSRDTHFQGIELNEKRFFKTFPMIPFTNFYFLVFLGKTKEASFNWLLSLGRRFG